MRPHPRDWEGQHLDRQTRRRLADAAPASANRAFQAMMADLRGFAHDTQDAAGTPEGDADARLVAMAERWLEPRTRQQTDTDGALRILAEVPGAAAADIFLAVTGEGIELEAKTEAGAYRAEIEVAKGFDPRTARLSCEDGYVEIRLEPWA